eukprot:1098569-Prymnesium_polylepis.1
MAEHGQRVVVDDHRKGDVPRVLRQEAALAQLTQAHLGVLRITAQILHIGRAPWCDDRPALRVPPRPKGVGSRFGPEAFVGLGGGKPVP